MFDESDSPPGSAEPLPDEPVPTEPATTEPLAPKPAAEPSPAGARFKKCRFHAEESGKEYCSNRDVLPYAGKSGFSAEAG